jgi:tetratricopeptide (TPR) repeat protein
MFEQTGGHLIFVKRPVSKVNMVNLFCYCYRDKELKGTMNVSLSSGKIIPRITALFIIFGSVFFFSPVWAGSPSRETKAPLLQGEEYRSKSVDFFKKSVEAFKTALKDPQTELEAHRNLAEISFQLGDYPEAISHWQKFLRMDPENEKALKQLGIAYEKNNDLQQALFILKRCRKINEQDPEIEFHLGSVNEKQYLFDEAIKHFQNVIDLEPKGILAERAHERLAIIDSHSSRKTYESIADEEVKNLVRTAPGSKEYPDAGAVVLLDEEVYIVNPDNTKTTTFHALIKILNDRGKHFGEVQIGYDSSYQTVTVDLARTIKTDGTLIQAGTKAMRDLAPWGGFPLYSNAKAKIISMPEVMPGAFIEYKATVKSTKLLNEDDFNIGKGLRFHEPHILQRLILSVPKERNININYVRLENGKPRVEKKEGRKIYTWEVKNQPEIISEPRMPPWADIIPIIQVSSFEDWKELADWFKELAKGQYTPTEAMKEKIISLTESVSTPTEKVRNLFHYVAAEIRYVGLEYGTSGYKPHKASEIFENKYGDCKDQSILLATMIRQLGIPAHLVLIATRSSGKVQLDIPMLQFNHCIVTAEVEGKRYWMDPTADTCTFGDIPQAIQDRNSLVMFDDEGRFIKTPLLPPERSTTIKEVELVLVSDGSIKGNSRTTTSGEDSMHYRRMKFTKPIKRKHHLERLVNGAYPGGKLLDYQFSDLDDLNVPVSLRMEYSGPSFLKKAGNLGIIEPPGIGMGAGLVSLEERQYPISFPGLWQDENQVVIVLPDNYTVYYLPEEVRLDCLPYFTYHLKYDFQDGKIRYTEKTKLKKRDIPVDDYTRYKEFRETVARETDKFIILKEKP